jgi:hypothetical protein
MPGAGIAQMQTPQSSEASNPFQTSLAAVANRPQAIQRRGTTLQELRPMLDANRCGSLARTEGVFH